MVDAFSACPNSTGQEQGEYTVLSKSATPSKLTSFFSFGKTQLIELHNIYWCVELSMAHPVICTFIFLFNVKCSCYSIYGFLIEVAQPLCRGYCHYTSSTTVEKRLIITPVLKIG